jgi:hypothetical protein
MNYPPNNSKLFDLCAVQTLCSHSQVNRFLYTNFDGGQFLKQNSVHELARPAQVTYAEPFSYRGIFFIQWKQASLGCKFRFRVLFWEPGSGGGGFSWQDCAVPATFDTWSLQFFSRVTPILWKSACSTIPKFLAKFATFKNKLTLFEEPNF